MDENELANALDLLVRKVRSGINLTTAAHSAGLSSSAVYEWIHRGKVEEERLFSNAKLKPKASEGGCLDLWKDIRKAQADAIAAVERSIIDAGADDWKASAWWLERRQSETFNKTIIEQRAKASIEAGEEFAVGEIE